MYMHIQLSPVDMFEILVIIYESFSRKVKKKKKCQRMIKDLLFFFKASILFLNVKIQGSEHVCWRVSLYTQ